MARIHSNNTAHFPWWLVTVVLGIFFRCVNFDSKIYWVDEVATSIRISGLTVQAVIEQIAAQGTVSVEELRQYLSPQPKDLSTTLEVLKQSPEHAPLYFLLARFWVQQVGNSTAALRSLSVIVSLLAFPALYWLCWELFQSARVGATALMLLSVSPFYVAYAQEARPYSLWIVTILLSGAALVRAIRLGSRRSWILYALSLVLGFYTFLLSIVVAVGHGIYVARRTGFKKYLICLGVGAIAFTPWLFVIGQHWQALHNNTTWMREPLALPAMVAIWVASVLLTFGDLPIPTTVNPIAVVSILMVVVGLISVMLVWFKFSRTQPRRFQQRWLTGVAFAIALAGAILRVDLITVIGITSALGVLILVVLSLGFLWTHSSYRASGFVLSLFFLPIVLIGSDLVTMGQRSTAPRYLMTAQLGIMIAVAFYLAARPHWLALLLALGLVSCLLNVNQSPKYQKGQNIHNPALAAAINQAHSPTVLAASADIPNLISLSPHLKSDVTVEILPMARDRSSNVFLFNPSKTLQQELGEQLEPVYQPQRYTEGEIALSLWRMKLSQKQDGK